MALDIHSEEFWLELRKKTSVNGSIGKRDCDTWGTQVLQFFINHVKADPFTPVTVKDANVLAPAGIKNFHSFLIDKGRGFVADGTAGQIDSRFPEGYYGLVEDAPSKMRAIYQLAFR